MTNCPRCQSSGNGQCVCQAGMAQGQAMAAANQRTGQAAQAAGLAGQSAIMAGIDARLASQAAALTPRKEPTTEQRIRSLAREAIRTAVQSIALTRRDDGNRVDTAVLKRALEAYREFQDACDPMTLLDLLDGGVD